MCVRISQTHLPKSTHVMRDLAEVFSSCKFSGLLEIVKVIKLTVFKYINVYACLMHEIVMAANDHA